MKMPYAKRKRSSSVVSRKPYAKRARSASSRGRTGYAGVLRASVRRASAGVQRLNRMIETKEGCWICSDNIGYVHNTTTVINLNGNPNPFNRTTGNDDPMAAGLRINGDSCKLNGIKATFFLENALGRPKVFYRIQLLKGPRGADFTNIYKGITGNQMIDQINTEKFTVIAAKRFTLTPSNPMANGVTLTGEPKEVLTIGGDYTAGVASKIVNFWIPGAKFGKSGVIQYENGAANLKFFDYRWVITVYDWFGTPILNTVGRINEGYIKIYYKDA